MPSTPRAAESSPAAAAACTTRCRDWTMREMDNAPSDATKNRRLLCTHALRCGRLPVAIGLNCFAVSSGCRSRTTRMGSWTCIPARQNPGRGQGGQLAARSEGALQSDHAPLRPEERGPDRQMEPAAGHEGPGAVGAAGPVRLPSERRCCGAGAPTQAVVITVQKS